MEMEHFGVLILTFVDLLELGDALLLLMSQRADYVLLFVPHGSVEFVTRHLMLQCEHVSKIVKKELSYKHKLGNRHLYTSSGRIRRGAGGSSPRRQQTQACQPLLGEALRTPHGIIKWGLQELRMKHHIPIITFNAPQR